MKDEFDYHNVTDIDTPHRERRVRNIGDIYINQATCAKCGDTIRSKHRHDYVKCKCGAIAVDGGSWYSRRSGLPDDFKEHKIVLYNDIQEDTWEYDS